MFSQEFPSPGGPDYLDQYLFFRFGLLGFWVVGGWAGANGACGASVMVTNGLSEWCEYASVWGLRVQWWRPLGSCLLADLPGFDGAAPAGSRTSQESMVQHLRGRRPPGRRISPRVCSDGDLDQAYVAIAANSPANWCLRGANPTPESAPANHICTFGVRLRLLPTIVDSTVQHLRGRRPPKNRRCSTRGLAALPGIGGAASAGHAPKRSQELHHRLSRAPFGHSVVEPVEIRVPAAEFPLESAAMAT